MSDRWAELKPATKEDPSIAWMMSFSDLIALLLAFFVLLFSMREMDMKGWDKLRGGMDGVFVTLESITEGNPQEAMPDAVQVVRRKGSVLPYLQQVWLQKMGGVAGAWAGSAMTYLPDAGELWTAWPEGGDVATVAGVLVKWRNRVRLVAGNADDAGKALAYLAALRQGGVVVVKEVRLTPGVAAGVWLVVEDKQ